MALEAVVRDAPAPPAPDASRKGWVNLVWRDWVPNMRGGRGGAAGRSGRRVDAGCVSRRDVGHVCFLKRLECLVRRVSPAPSSSVRLRNRDTEGFQPGSRS